MRSMVAEKAGGVQSANLKSASRADDWYIYKWQDPFLQHQLTHLKNLQNFCCCFLALIEEEYDKLEV